MSETMNTKNKQMSHSHPWKRFLGLALLAALLFGGTVLVLFKIPDVYEQTFLGELEDKFTLLCETNEPKIILVGGSSVAFGVDSALIEEHTGYKVVNFGLYATLGTKLMLDLSEANINEGDIVVLAPELDSQTLSLYFNAEAAWQGIGSCVSMLRYVGSENLGDMMGGLYDYLGSSLSYLRQGITLSPSGVYRHDSFNAYGDIEYERPYNIMTVGYDVNQPILLDESIMDAEFLDYLNRYIRRVKDRGAEVYFSLCPLNKSALADETSEESIVAFFRFLNENIGCEVISGFDTAIMEENYFYDTNFHLNDAGVLVHTAALIDDINRALGSTYRHGLSLPKAPERPSMSGPDNWVENEWSALFLYEEYGDGLAIVGVAEAAMERASLILPYKANGKVVYVVAKGAFEGCDSLREITVPDNYALFENGAFSGAENLREIHMRRGESENLEVGKDLFEGASDELVILLYSEETYTDFATGYWWATHSSRMRLVD